MKTNHRILLCRISILVAAFTVTMTAEAQVAFSDDFNSEPSPLWGNERGNWAATGGVYSAQAPANNPPTYSSLPFVFTDLTFDVDINQVSDGGISFHADAGGLNEVLLVTGGNGWGSGNTGAGVGTSLYWHIVTNGVTGPKQQEALNVFTIGQNAHLTLSVTGNTYKAFVNGTLKSTFVDNTFTSGRVGLYDFSRAAAVNQSINGTFDNVSIAAPEPSSAFLFLSGAAFCLRRRSLRTQECNG